MKFKFSWLTSAAPLILTLITEALNERQMQQNVKEEVERTLRENGYIINEKNGS